MKQKDIDAIKPDWQDGEPTCCCKVLGEPPLASPDGCKHFRLDSVDVKGPTEQVCECPGAEQQTKWIGTCIAAVKNLMVKKFPD